MNLAYDSLDDLIVVAAPSLAYDSLDDLVVIALDDYDPSEPRDKSGEWTKGSEPSRVEHTQYGDVQVNPGPTELKGVFNKLRGTREYRDVPTLRVLGHEGNLYAWPSGQAIHDDMATELGLVGIGQPEQVEWTGGSHGASGGWYTNGLKHLTTINEDKAKQFGYDLRKAWIAAANEEPRQAADDFNPSEPRVPEGQPGGGEWTAGGSTEGVVAPIDPEVANVGGDEWNKATAKRLALEYAKAKPALEAIAKEIGRTLKFADLTPEEQALFKQRYIDGRTAEIKEALLDDFKNSVGAAQQARFEQATFFKDPEKKAQWLTAQANEFYGRLPDQYKANLAKDGIDAAKLADSWHIIDGAQYEMVSLKADMTKVGGPNAYLPGRTQHLLDDLRYDLNTALKQDWQKRRYAQKPNEEAMEKNARLKATDGFEGLLNGEGAAGRDGDQVNVRIKQYVPAIWEKYAKAPTDEPEPPAKPWTELPLEKQNEVKSHWLTTNENKFYKAEVAHWKKTKMLADAAKKLADGFNTKTTEDTYSQKWAKDALQGLFTPVTNIYDPDDKKFGFKGGTPIEYNANLPSR